MKLEIKRDTLVITPESVLDEVYFEEVLKLVNKGDRAIFERKDVQGMLKISHIEVRKDHNKGLPVAWEPKTMVEHLTQQSNDNNPIANQVCSFTKNIYSLLTKNYRGFWNLEDQRAQMTYALECAVKAKQYSLVGALACLLDHWPETIEPESPLVAYVIEFGQRMLESGELIVDPDVSVNELFQQRLDAGDFPGAAHAIMLMEVLSHAEDAKTD